MANGPTPAQLRARFVAATRREARRLGREVDEGALRMAGTLAELQADIRRTLAAAPSEFEVVRLPELLAEVDRHLLEWQRRAIGVATEGIERAGESGPELVDAPLRAVNIQAGRTILPASLLDELKDFAADKITALRPAARQRIEQQVRIAVLGGQSPHQAMQQIARALPGRPLGFVSFRAETIYRTEVGRVHSIAADRRLRDAAAVVHGLKKQWLWSGQGRQTHAAANGQIREVDEPFSVGGEHLRFPRDPAGRPENTINCGCESIPWKDDWQ